jgi:inosose dehydratase
MTNPQLLALLYDTGHLAFSGEDYVGVLERHIERVRHVHLKDLRLEVLDRAKKERMSFLTAVKEGVFTVPGDGGLSFEPVFRLLERKGYRGWYVVEAEQDPAKANPFEYAVKARAFIREKAGL